MECLTVQQEILESFDIAASAKAQPEIGAHLAKCPVCAGFAARQKMVDARLRAMFVPPEMSPAFRTALRKRIRREKMRLWADSLPDVVHLVSSVVATLVCAMLLPFDASAIWGAGAAASAMIYILIAAVRISFEDAEDAGQ